MASRAPHSPGRHALFLVREARQAQLAVGVVAPAEQTAG